MKGPLICLTISLGAVVAGSAICLPGICGCAGWLPIPNRDSFGVLFMFLFFGGVLGIPVSLLWLAAAALWNAVAGRRSQSASQLQ
jgi:hypothetical protein